LRELAENPLHGLLRFAGIGPAGVDGLWFHGQQMSTTARSRRPATTRKASCENCYFKCNLLCALEQREPCPTFRPDSPEGLRPPSQLRFVFRQEQRTQSAYAFPSAQDQAALYA